MSKYSVSIPEKEWIEIKEYCDDTGRTISGFLRISAKAMMEVEDET